MSIGNLFGTGGESNSLYGTSFNSNVASSFIYFEWFIFKTSTGQPATPTGGSWDFLTNTGTPPTGWTSTISGVPLDNLWFSIAFVDSRNPTNIVWSAPGLIAASSSVYATAYADTFTGTGSTTNWTLTTDPVVVNNLDVSINGVTQTPTVDYTISGTTFTTTTAAPLGSIILVKYRQALPNSYFGTANNVGYTPHNWIAATNVQTALDEVADDISATDGVSGSNLVGYKPVGTGAVATTVQSKLRQTINVKDFGAAGDGVTDDAAAILKAFNYSRSIGGCAISFPKATYLISHGFNVPTNTTIYLNGSVIKATTTFSQGTIPTYGALSIFEISNRVPFSGAPAIENISFIGDGAILDGRRDEQTGSVAGYDGFLIETSDTAQQADFGKIRNILVSDITIDRSGFDGFYVSGVDDMEVRNLKTFFSPRIGIVVVGGTNIRFIDCESSYTIGDNVISPTPGPSNSGDGYWNEPNETWQTIDVKYLNCYASKNYQSGFKPYNAGADATLSIELIACKGFDNCWDEVTGTRRSAPSEANFRVSLNPTASASAYILFKDCVSQTSERSGFSIQRGAASGAGYVQRIIVDNLTVMDCNRSNTDGANRSPIYIPTTAATTYPLIVFNAPVVISTYNNTAGYGISVDDPTGVFINNPIFAGVFSEQLYITGTFPGSRTTSNVPNFFIDPNADQSPNGIAGDVTKFYKPIRLASWDQTGQPSSGDLFANELSVWQTDDNQFVGMFKRDDSAFLQYLDYRNERRIRGVLNLSGASANISAQSVETHTLTVTGAVVGAYVEVSINVALNNALILQAQVSAANTVTVNIHNPSSGTISRAAGYVTVNVLSSE